MIATGVSGRVCARLVPLLSADLPFRVVLDGLQHGLQVGHGLFLDAGQKRGAKAAEEWPRRSRSVFGWAPLRTHQQLSVGVPELWKRTVAPAVFRAFAQAA